MPFQLAHKNKTDENCIDSDSGNDENTNVHNSTTIVSTDDIASVVEAIEEQQCDIFDKAKINIKRLNNIKPKVTIADKLKAPHLL